MTVNSPMRQGGLLKAGHLAAAGVNLALLVATNWSPGWRALPFVTEAAAGIIGYVNVSFAAGMVLNLLYLGFGRAWLRGMGAVVALAIVAVALIQIWHVFPFRPGNEAYLTRLVLAAGIAVTGVALQLKLIAFIRRLMRLEQDHDTTQRHLG
jgi:hypothetical protein